MTSTAIEPVFDGRIWRGVTRAYGVRFMVEAFPSDKHPGYYHFSVISMADRNGADGTASYIDSTVNPIENAGVNQFLNIALKREGLVVKDFKWTEVANKSELLIEHAERPQYADKK